MLGTEVVALRNELEDRNILFAYSGHVSERILAALCDALKHRLTVDHADRAVVRKVFSVFVEQVQNIMRYSAETLPEPPSASPPKGVITVGYEDGKFFVQCGNPMKSTESGVLQQRLEYIASLDRDQLKTYYKEKLKEEPETGSKGASVGLVEIARRSTEPLKYDFTEIGQGHTLFVLKAYI